jgi:hypothetical protein
MVATALSFVSVPLAYFALLNTGAAALVFLAIVLSLIPHDMMWGLQAARIAECFTPRLRYSGFSLGYHLASITAGGPAPLIATAMFAWTQSGYTVAVYIFLCGVVSVLATLLMPDYMNRDISQGGGVILSGGLADHGFASPRRHSTRTAASSPSAYARGIDIDTMLLGYCGDAGHGRTRMIAIFRRMNMRP